MSDDYRLPLNAVPRQYLEDLVPNLEARVAEREAEVAELKAALTPFVDMRIRQGLERLGLGGAWYDAKAALGTPGEEEP